MLSDHEPTVIEVAARRQARQDVKAFGWSRNKSAFTPWTFDRATKAPRTLGDISRRQWDAAYWAERQMIDAEREAK